MSQGALSSLLDLSGKAAIVTGGAKGIGQGIAKRLAEANAKVLVADLDITAAQQTVEVLLQHDWTAEAILTDVADEASVRIMIKTCQEKFGSVDILVNNAGIYPPTPLANMSQMDFEKVMATNLRSVFLTTKYAAEVMKPQGGGRIINITSIDALHPSMIGLAHYDASKHGLWGFTKSSALELADYKIWINAIAPGGITTPGVAALSQGATAKQMTAVNQAFLEKVPMHRMGDADEVATVALFLASSMSSYMTGTQIVVDGGALLS